MFNESSLNLSIWHDEQSLANFHLQMDGMDKTASAMLELLMVDVLSSEAGSRTCERIQKILPVLRHNAPLFYNLSKGECL